VNAASSENSHALAFRHVSKSFGAAPALKDFSLDVPHGALFALVGGNGAGKTTLIKCLLDFCDTDSGDIEIFGISSRRTAARANVAFLPERFIPAYYLTGRDFLRYMTKLYRVEYDESLVLRTLDRLDLAREALDKPVRAYSKGMTQKLGLAACLVSRKKLYILDEPTSGLDPKARALLKRELYALRESGHSVFFTSHALADVHEICDRMAVLHGGTLRFSGTPNELISRESAGDLEEAFLRCIGEAVAA
jgi:ABC-2 type transport system ATP-binding protein